MIYKKKPVVETDEFDITEFCKPGLGGDRRFLRDWRPGVEARAEDVYNKKGNLLGTLVFVWAMDKQGLKWNEIHTL